MKKIRVRFYSLMTGHIDMIYSIMERFELWKNEPNCIDIMDCETGEMLYIKGL